MENVTTSEHGASAAGVPSGVTVALKNGWLPLNASDTDWQINSIGWVSGDGRNYLLAVLTTGNPSEQYGIDTIDELSGLVWASLGLKQRLELVPLVAGQVVGRSRSNPTGSERHLVLGCLLVGRRCGLVVRVGGVIRRAAARGLVVRPAGVVVVHLRRRLPRIGQILDHR